MDLDAAHDPWSTMMLTDCITGTRLILVYIFTFISNSYIAVALSTRNQMIYDSASLYTAAQSLRVFRDGTFYAVLE